MHDLHEYLKQQFTMFKGGSLRIFGDWFGRPYDNIHILKTFSFVDDILTVTFDDDETLIIWKSISCADPRAHVQSWRSKQGPLGMVLLWQTKDTGESILS